MLLRVSEPAIGRPSWAEIDLAALGRNLAWLRDRSPGRRAIAVVKADAYGHGAIPCAQTLVAEGAEMLAVATVSEALELREGGLTVPILLLEGIHAAEEAIVALQSDLIPAVGRLDALEPLELAAREEGRRFPVHLKFDTGMGRLGLAWEQAGPVLDRVCASPGLQIEGLMSHHAEADDPDSPIPGLQRRRFAGLVGAARARGLRPEWVHLDNSPGVVHGPTEGTTAIRPGLLLYGADPTREGSARLEPVMTLVSRPIHAKDVPVGTRVGYGGKHVTSTPTRILTLPLGYADGLPRNAGGRISVGLRGARVPVVGRVSMDLITVDAGPDSDAGLDDELLLFGRRDGFEIRVEDQAEALGTIAYELLSRLAPRVPRVFR
jgi:alanine racemase